MIRLAIVVEGETEEVGDGLRDAAEPLITLRAQGRGEGVPVAVTMA